MHDFDANEQNGEADAAPSRRPGRRAAALLLALTVATGISLAGFEEVAWDRGSESDPGDCVIDPVAQTAPGCRQQASDSAATRDPITGLWGSIECAAADRIGWQSRGGDQAPTADGSPQGDDAFRSLRVVDGDDFYGERCELGRNESRYAVNGIGDSIGTFALYLEGQRRITMFSQRYGQGFDERAGSWQTVMQMKQAQPADNGDGPPVVEIQIRDGQLLLVNSGEVRWETMAPVRDAWVRYAVDATYFSDADSGSIRIYVDVDGDGSWRGPTEISPAITMPTLQTESESGGVALDRLRVGEPIPSHLRLGLYHDPALECPQPAGCQVDLDNVQVLAPGD